MVDVSTPVRWLLRLAAPRPRRAEMLDFDRRRFLGGAVALAGVAAGSGVVGRLLLDTVTDLEVLWLRPPLSVTVSVTV